MKLHKITVLLLCIFGIGKGLQAQYVVVHISEEGKIKRENGTPLKFQDRLTPEDKLSFDNKNVHCVAMWPSKSVVFLKAPESAEDKILVALKDCIGGDLESNMLGTKELKDKTHEVDRKEELFEVLGMAEKKEDVRVATFTDSVDVRLRLDEYPVNNTSFFFVKYEYKGEVVRKKLYKHNKHLFVSPDIYVVDGKKIDRIPNEMTLVYVDQESGLKELGYVDWRFNTTHDLQKSFGLLYSGFPEADKKDFYETVVLPYLNTNHNLIEPDDLSGLVKTAMKNEEK